MRTVADYGVLFVAIALFVAIGMQARNKLPHRPTRGVDVEITLEAGDVQQPTGPVIARARLALAK